MRSVLLVDDHPVVAVGLRLALQDSQEFQLIGTVSNPASCLAAIEDCPLDALIIDLVFDGVIQLDLVAQCRAVLPHATIVVFSSLPENLYGRQAIVAGADAYLNKSTDLSALCRRLAEIIAGGPARLMRGGISGGGETPAPHPVLDGVHLTQREMEIARYVGRGFSIALIAKELGISSNTVAVHRDNIRKKLKCRDTKDLVARLARMDGPTGA